MSMHKSDYELIAEVMKRNKVDHDTPVDLANALYMANDSFDTRRFMAACGDL